MEYPKINEYWHVQYGSAVGKEYNIIVRVIENKKGLNPNNWRKNDFKCEHHGKEIIVSGEFFIELMLRETRVFSDTVSPVGIDILKGEL